ncbi:MAG: peptide chain release factor 2, partial [Syntrophales bacterium LBB04]|nr:peptide chain release factor 2 [Syntrophales bacterium LBB04]
MNSWGVVFDVANIEYSIKELEKKSLTDDFWNDRENAGDILREKNRLLTVVDNWKKHKKTIDELVLLYELA